MIHGRRPLRTHGIATVLLQVAAVKNKSLYIVYQPHNHANRPRIRWCQAPAAAKLDPKARSPTIARPTASNEEDHFPRNLGRRTPRDHQYRQERAFGSGNAAGFELISP